MEKPINLTLREAMAKSFPVWLYLSFHSVKRRSARADAQDTFCGSCLGSLRAKTRPAPTHTDQTGNKSKFDGDKNRGKKNVLEC